MTADLATICFEFYAQRILLEPGSPGKAADPKETSPVTDTLIIVTIALAAVVLLQVVLLFRQGKIEVGPFHEVIQPLERSLREELGRNREEASAAARRSREGLANAMRGLGDSLNQQMSTLTQTIDQRFDRLRILSSNDCRRSKPTAMPSWNR